MCNFVLQMTTKLMSLFVDNKYLQIILLPGHLPQTISWIAVILLGL